MSVGMTKADGVTVLTLTSDPNSACPPLCQIFKALCYSPVCCSVSQQLRRVQKTSQSVLGALQIMVGFLNIGLGLVLKGGRGGPWWIMDSMFPFWLGSLFIVFGIMCILSEKFPSRCLVIINVILNLTGVCFAITAIVLYSINVVESGWDLWSMCDDRYDYWYGRHERITASPSPEKAIMQEKCLEAKALILMLNRSVNAVMIVMSALELCLVISSVVLGIKALKSSQKGENKSTDEPEHYKPLLEEVTTYPVV
ncbi:membrane-spanning 4-domains subfamily A member 4D-like [Scomber scombrus]|uniref:membrane-spanning 4-domains subfamily A member 4D-like n=1 Tax=Scomber scombrus TaxID=13677 RepID=UPI002DDA8F9E|nr:membrane-spanning 4-domains subfamily A member 4D-like [Scomber scombrus]XP_062277678.1 membrane-spanning 4-domains subfamily A member 4D-like [Scomber scombrus]